MHISKQKFEHYMDLLLINRIISTSGILIDLCSIRQTIKIKNTFADIGYNDLKVLIEHKEIFLEINGKQSLKPESGSIKFKNHFKQLVVPSKVYADF